MGRSTPNLRTARHRQQELASKAPRKELGTRGTHHLAFRGHTHSQVKQKKGTNHALEKDQ